MSKILELREKRAKAWEAAKAFLDSKRGSDGLLSPEDTAAYEKMEADVVALGKEIERLERQAAIDLELSKPVSNPITNKPAPQGETKTGRATDEYRNAFWKAMRSKLSFDVQNALQIGTESEGGYLVPDEFERTLVEALEEENIFRQIANVITTSSGDRKIPVVASKGTASWVDEEGQIPESDDSFAQVSIGAYKLATMIKVICEPEGFSYSGGTMVGYDAKKQEGFFRKAWQNAVELCVMLCREYGLDENDIICHSEGYRLGIASNHADVMHWLPKHGESMDTFRAAVKRALEKDTNDSAEIGIGDLVEFKDSAGNYYPGSVTIPSWVKTDLSTWPYHNL